MRMDFSVFLRLFNFLQIAYPPDAQRIDGRPAPSNGSGEAESRNWNAQDFFQAQMETGVDCRGVLGCFPITNPWEGPNRPVSLHPESLEDVCPFFCFHSFQKPECEKFGLAGDFDLSRLDVTSETHLIVITHGFLHSIETEWMKEMVSALLENVEENLRIITLNWSNASTPPYAQAVANTRLMGAIVGYLLERLQIEKELQLSQTHLVGHSLGAHLFGYAGSFVSRFNASQKVGRITGMDPAGPYFEDASNEIRLDHSDAFLVDILHTDSTALIPTLPTSLGLPESSGHLDFYPNGGEEQTGCGKKPQVHKIMEKGIAEGFLDVVSCSHERSHAYFTSSLSKGCTYVGVECSSWSDYKEGKCWDCDRHRCFKMGFDIGRIYSQGRHCDPQAPTEDFYELISDGDTQVKLFLATTSNEELCGEQLRFSIIASNSETAQKKGGEYAKFKIVLRGDNKNAETSPRKTQTFIAPGQSLQWVDAVPFSIGDIHSMIFTYEEEKQYSLMPFSIFRITSPTLYLQEVVVESLITNQRKTFIFCNPTISLGGTVTLKEKCKKEQSSQEEEDNNY